MNIKVMVIKTPSVGKYLNKTKSYLKDTKKKNVQCIQEVTT